MTPLLTFPVVFGIIFITMSKGTDGNKRGHIIQTLLEEMRKDQTNDAVTHGASSELWAPMVNRLPDVGEVYTIPLAREDDVNQLRPLILNDLDISLDQEDTTESALRKRFMTKMNEERSPDYMRNELQRYIIKKVKREPENYPIEMYPVQGGKQQLEVDLDNELNENEIETIEKVKEIDRDEHNELVGQGHELNENGNDFSEIENALSENGNELNENELSGENVEEASKDITDVFPADIIIGGADLPAIETKLKDNYMDDDSRKKRSFSKRFWAANQLYKLKQPKSFWNRSHRTRQALPRFDPILYFIGLGK